MGQRFQSFSLFIFNKIETPRDECRNRSLDLGMLIQQAAGGVGPQTAALLRLDNLSMKKFMVYMGIVVALVIASAGVASADQVFTTQPGATNPLSGQSVSATADFSLSGNTLTLTLSNTIAGIGSVGQLLTGVTFTRSE